MCIWSVIAILLKAAFEYITFLIIFCLEKNIFRLFKYFFYVFPSPDGSMIVSRLWKLLIQRMLAFINGLVNNK